MNVFDAAADVVRAGWMKGFFTNDDQTEFCMLGALGMASNGFYDHFSKEDTDLLEEIIKSEYPDRLPEEKEVLGVNGPITYKMSIIPGFNDHEDTTLCDVVTVFEKASARRDEQI